LDVPVQFFQSVIGIEVAITGALLFEIRFFDRDTTRRAGEAGPDGRWLVLFALVLFATVFGSLWGIVHHGQQLAASFVTAGLAISLLPILSRALASSVPANARGHSSAHKIVGLLAYVVLVTAVVVLLNV
jgi:hypothetical protein